MALTTFVDDVFLREMAARFPQAAFSCLAGARLGGAAHAPRRWLADIGAGADAAAWDGNAAIIEAALAAQRGAPWGGIGAEPLVRRVTLLALAAYTTGYPIGDLLSDLNMWAAVRAARDDAAALAGADGCDLMALVDDSLHRAAAPVIERAAAGHGWSNTVALAVIEAAKRCNGVLPSAHFLWLKPHDRTLWLLLNGYGRREPMAETLGAVAHFEAERLMGRPLDEALMASAAVYVVDTAVRFA